MTARSATQTRASRRPCTSVIALPAMLTYLLARAWRGTCGQRPHLPLTLLRRVVFVNDVAHVIQLLGCNRSANCTVRRFALVKAHGFGCPARRGNASHAQS